MVARTASQLGGFGARLAVAIDGSVATLYEASRITVLALPDGTAFAEIGVDPEALVSEVAWLGAPPRLLVMSRYAAHSTAHLLDPYGPRTVAEIRLETPVRLFASVGSTALIVGALGPAVLVASESHLTFYPFSSRAAPLAAGVAAHQFVVALPASIEEWDPQSRAPRRRFRLPRAAAITSVGGSERVLWMTTQQEPSRIDVIPLFNRGQPRAHDLPEPIAAIAGHPRSDLVVCIGAETGRLHIIDLDGRARMRTLVPDAFDHVDSVALVVGRTIGVLAAQTGHPAALLPLDHRDAPLEPMGKSAAIATAMVELAGHASPSEPDASTDAPDPLAIFEAVVPAPLAIDIDTAAASAAPSWEPAELPPPVSRSAAPAPASTTAPSTLHLPRAASPALRPARRTWRDDIVDWTRAALSGAGDHRVADHGAAARRVPTAAAFETLITRFELSAALHPALVLLYGAHLCGERGAAPVDVARILDGNWDEALGRGELAASGIAYHAASRVALSPLVLRLLDELPPVSGALVGEPGPIALLGPCIVVAGDEPLAAVAERCLARVGGAILAAHRDADPATLLLEARAHGAVAMLRGVPEAVPPEPVIFVTDDADLAERAAMPRLA